MGFGLYWNFKIVKKYINGIGLDKQNFEHNIVNQFGYCIEPSH